MSIIVYSPARKPYGDFLFAAILGFYFQRSLEIEMSDGWIYLLNSVKMTIMKSESQNLLDKAKSGIAEIAAKYDLKFAVLFGTAASGAMRESSDVDVAVLKADHVPLFFDQFSRLASDLEELLESGFRRIDLVDLAKANILLRYEITSKGILLYGDEGAYEDYRIFAFKDYIDSQSLRDLEAVIIKKRQEILAAQFNA